MSIMDYAGPTPSARTGVAARVPLADRPLHRLATIRNRQHVSRRTVARHLKTDINQVKAEEDERADLHLSTFYEWQKVLDVPVAELLVDSDDPLSAPVLKRAQMLRLMKTAKTILKRSSQAPIRRMAEMLVNQILEIMPELEDVSPWHAVGQRRTQDELGEAAVRVLPIDWFREPKE